MKIVWKIGDKPTGRYRSFSYRAWPSATLGREGQPLAQMYVANDTSGKQSYHHSIAETEVLIVSVAHHQGGKFEWRRLKARPRGVTEAKQLVVEFYQQNPEWLPKEEVK